MKAPRGELGVELDLGQQLPEAGILSGQLAERSLHPLGGHPAFLSPFLVEAHLLAMAGRAVVFNSSLRSPALFLERLRI